MQSGNGGDADSSGCIPNGRICPDPPHDAIVLPEHIVLPEFIFLIKKHIFIPEYIFQKFILLPGLIFFTPFVFIITRQDRVEKHFIFIQKHCGDPSDHDIFPQDNIHNAKAPGDNRDAQDHVLIRPDHDSDAQDHRCRHTPGNNNASDTDSGIGQNHFHRKARDRHSERERQQQRTDCRQTAAKRQSERQEHSDKAGNCCPQR